MNYEGILIGLGAFLIIGIFHPLVIKGEYYFSVSIWPLFLLLGIAFSIASLFVDNSVVSALIGTTGFSSFWSIMELFDQRKRVEKGWFPDNPKRINTKVNDSSGSI